MHQTPSLPIPRVSPVVSAVAGAGRSSSGQRIAPAGGTATGPDVTLGARP
jgi:hypothetical protein